MPRWRAGSSPILAASSRRRRRRSPISARRNAMPIKVAVVQSPPVLLDRAATLAGMVKTVAEVAGQGAGLIVFPEAYLPGYPTWAWRLKPGADGALAGDIHARLRAEAVDLLRDDLAPLREAAAAHAVTVVTGLNELD